MRAVTPVSRTRRPFRKRKSLSAAPRTVCPHTSNPNRGAFFFLCSGCFLLSYFPGILAGRSGASSLGQQLAAYYMDKGSHGTWLSLFFGQAASAFLQLVLVWLCGFAAFGLGLLILLFAFKGLFLGFCCANVLALGGIKSLCLYWLSDGLPNVLLLLVQLWLAGYAAALSKGLFQSIFLGGAPRDQPAANARRLSVRFLLSLLLSGLFSVLCSAFFFFLFRFFLR